jgi:23S rRNA (pseudouridine1915-N3)-methyltransferase
MLAAIRRDDYVVALEVGGKAMSTEELSAWLARRMQEGRALALLIGGPDGLAPQCSSRADQQWSLSPLTCRMRWCGSSSPSSSTGP